MKTTPAAHQIQCVVPLSGGKDSQACLLLALQQYKPEHIRGLFCDTRFEHPLTYAHLDTMQQNYGVKIDRITAGTVPEQVLKAGRFPTFRARFCTDRLKMRPSRDYYKALAQEQGGFQVWFGMRSDESKEREKRYRFKTNDALYAPHDVFEHYPKYLYQLGVTFRLPILDWSTAEVFRLLNNQYNPLYSKGCDRVGCFPCLAAGDAVKNHDFNMDETGCKHYVIVQELEKTLGKSVFTSKTEAQRRNTKQIDLFQGCALCAI